jgi:hypothetical protein
MISTGGEEQPVPINAYLAEMFVQARATRDRVVHDFGALDGDQLNWKPSPDRWSVAQCLQHLITSNEQYWPALEAIAAGSKTSTIYERLPLLPLLWGALVRRAVAPDSGIRSRTSASLVPSASDLPGSIVSDFAANVEAHLERIAATGGVDHRRVIVTSPIARFITYSVKDAVIITITHLERHYRQASRVMAHEAFPSGESP